MKKGRLGRFLLCVAAVEASDPFSTHADQGREGAMIGLTWENDALAGNDRHYTQGARVFFWSADDALPHWLERFSEILPALAFSPEAEKWGISLSQEIYTPENLRTRNLGPEDRPYAGWLFATFSLQRRGEVAPRLWTRDQWSVDLGVVGPEALAEETQKTWHSKDPIGWDTQLQTEPGVVLHYDRSYLYAPPVLSDPWRLDLIPRLHFAAGNVAVFGEASGTVRVGYHTPNEYEAPIGRTPFTWGAYAFATVAGRLVAHSIFLDGNTFSNSHSVEREPYVREFQAGIGFVLKRFEIQASHTLRSSEFQGQDSANDSFSSATLLYKF